MNTPKANPVAAILSELQHYERRETRAWRLANAGMYAGYAFDYLLNGEGGITMLAFILAVLLLIIYLGEGNGQSFSSNVRKKYPEAPVQIFPLLKLTQRAQVAQLGVFVLLFGQQLTSESSWYAVLFAVTFSFIADRWATELSKKRHAEIEKIVHFT